MHCMYFPLAQVRTFPLVYYTVSTGIHSATGAPRRRKRGTGKGRVPPKIFSEGDAPSPKIPRRKKIGEKNQEKERKSRKRKIAKLSISSKQMGQTSLNPNFFLSPSPSKFSSFRRHSILLNKIYHDNGRHFIVGLYHCWAVIYIFK